MLAWKLWTVYTGMFAVTAILSCVIKIRGLFKSTKCGRLKMSNLKLSQPGVNHKIKLTETELCCGHTAFFYSINCQKRQND